MFNKVLLAVDGSGRSQEMLKMLLQLPSMKRPPQVTALHVIPIPASIEGLTEYRLAGERILEKTTTNLNLPPESGYTTRLEEGDPKNVVCKVVEELQPSLLIMGSRGMGRLQAILANSVSQYVFQLVSVPMLLIKDDVYIKNIRNIAVALDGSPASEQCLDSAISLINGLAGGEIFLIRVVRKKEGTEAADPVIEKAIAKLKRFNLSYRTFLRTGDVGKEICSVVEETSTSLLMMASPERRPSAAKNLPDLDRLLGSSVSDYVRVHASSPVLLTRPLEQ